MIRVREALKPAATNLLAYTVSCSTECVYVSPEGRSDGLVNGYLPGISSNAYVTAVSCSPGGAGCIAVDSAGASYIGTKSGWTKGPQVEKATALGFLSSISCTSMTFCVAMDYFGGPLVFNGTKWTKVKSNLFGDLYVSCASTYLCVAGSPLGQVSVWDGTRWTTHALASAGSTSLSLAESNAIVGVSCPTVTYCAAATPSRVYSTTIPSSKTHVHLSSGTVAQRKLGHTLVKVVVTGAGGPTGTVEVTTGTTSGPTCVATLKAGTTSSSASCYLVTKRAGPLKVSAQYEGALGFAPSTPASLTVNVQAKTTKKK